MAKPLVFLGGTCGKNNWRDSFIDECVEGGVAREVLFNPVVADWNEAAQASEEKMKRECPCMVFYLGSPKEPGIPLSAYSMVEATMALYDKAEGTVVVFDEEGIEGPSLKSFRQTRRVLEGRFPNARVYDRREAVNYVVSQFSPKAWKA